MPRHVSDFDTETTDPNLGRRSEAAHNQQQTQPAELDPLDIWFPDEEADREQGQTLLTQLQQESASIPTILIDRTPAVTKKATARVKLTPKEIARQEVDEDSFIVMQELERAKKDLIMINARIEAQDGQTIASKERIAELQATRQEAVDYIRRHEVQPEDTKKSAIVEQLPPRLPPPTVERQPEIVRNEVLNQINTLNTLATASSQLYKASAEFGRDKTDAQEADRQLQEKQDVLDEDYRIFLGTIRAEQKKLPEFQQQALSNFPLKISDGPLAFTQWTNDWWDKVSSISLWRPLKLNADTTALDKFRHFILATEKESSFLGNLQTRQQEINALRNTYNQRVIEQQEYIANFTKKLNTVIKAGLPELPKNLNDSERQALMEALSPIKADLEDTAILLSIYANTLQRLRNFHEKVADRFIALRDNTNLPTEAEYEPGAIVRNVAKQEKQKDSSLSLDWEKNGNQEKLQKYIDRKVEKSAEWFAAMLLKGNKGSISKNYYLLKAKRHVNPDGESYEPEELEDAWNALDNFIKTLPK